MGVLLLNKLPARCRVESWCSHSTPIDKDNKIKHRTVLTAKRAQNPNKLAQISAKGRESGKVLMYAIFPTVRNLCCTVQKGSCQRVTMGFILLVGKCNSFCKGFPLRILTFVVTKSDRLTMDRVLLVGSGQFSNKTSQSFFWLKRQKSQTGNICCSFEDPG